MARLLAGDRASDAIVENIRQQIWDWTSHCMYSFTATSATCFMVTWEHPFVPGVRCWKSCDIFPATLELAFCALLLALIGIPLGILSAVWRNRWLDHLLR
ncbi:hypothetical protein ACVXHA_20050 [Escherichia coli]